MSDILREGEQFPIRPSDISTEGHLWGAFDHYETEVSAAFVVRLCQQRGNWHPFTEADIEAVYNEVGHTGFTFNRLVHGQLESRSMFDAGLVMKGGGWLVEEDGRYFVTEGFVNRMHRSSGRKAGQDAQEGGRG